MPFTNSLNINSSGVVTYNSTTGVFSESSLTQYNTLVGGASNSISSIAPSATVGYPLTSNGSAANPAFTSTATLNQLTVVNTPVNPSDATNKNYVDLIAAGFTFVDAANAGTTANLTATYANGASGVGATLTNAGALAAFAVDGFSASVGSRILVKNQTTQFQNGVYSVTTLGSGAVAWVLTRTTDYDTTAQIIPGSFVPVLSGTVNGGTFWTETNTVATIGTSAIAFNQFGLSASQFLQVANNLSDLSNVVTARSNLGLTAVATQSLTQYGVLVGGAANSISSIGAGATTGQIFQANTGANPTYSTATYPSTTTVNQLLYSSASNTVGGLATVNNGTLVTSSTGVPTWLGNSATAGYVLTANTGAPPSWQAAGTTSITITGDSGGGLTGNSFTFTGGSTGLTFAGAGSTETLGGILKLSNGGTNANLTASNGGIFYSTGTAGAILSGTATANQVLLSGSSSAPSWSTATYPATVAISSLLYASAANAVTALAPTNNGVLISSTTGVPSWLANAGSSNYVLTSTVGSPPSWQPSTSLSWTPVSTTTQTMAANTAYITNTASTVTYTLPAAAAVGSILRITGGTTAAAATPWTIAQNAGQSIAFGNLTTTVGVTGSLASSLKYDSIEIVCVATNTAFVVQSSVGNLQVT